jgi:cysteine desulfurase / selenocysteine lyase
MNENRALLLDLKLPAEVDLIYLDHAATSYPKPPDVYELMDLAHRTLGVNPGRSGFDRCREAGALIDETRDVLCTLFGGKDPDRLVFTANATDALNLAILGLVGEGDHVVTTCLEHNAVIRPLWLLQETAGVRIDWVPFDRDGLVDPHDVISRLRSDTRLVVMNHASNVTGIVQDVAPIGAACRDRGIPFLLDVSQTSGKVRVNLDQLNADILCFTGHKGLMGPMGTGGLYVREGIEIRQVRAGGTGVRSAERRHPPEYPYRLEFGTANLPGIVGLSAGVQWVKRTGVDRIHGHEMELWRLLREGLSEIDNVTLYGQNPRIEDRIAVLAFNVRGFESADVGTLLDVDAGIACRSGLHCAPMVHEKLGTMAQGGAVRFSLGPYTRVEDIERSLASVRDLAGIRRLERHG